MKHQIVACIDSSASALPVCDAAIWVSQKTSAPVHFLHVLEKPTTATNDDLSGLLGIDSREQLLDELVELDEQRNKIAIEHGKRLLQHIKQHAELAGLQHVSVEQRHDQLKGALVSREQHTQFFVIGRSGDKHDLPTPTIGSHAENVVRSIQTPVLIATGQFHAPETYMIAYDGSDSADKNLQHLAHTPLIQGLTGHIVMVAPNTDTNQQRLAHATDLMKAQGHTITSHLLDGDIVASLMSFQTRFGVQLKIMGAYGHSRIREFIVGSNTTKMLANSTTPVLVWR